MEEAAEVDGQVIGIGGSAPGEGQLRGVEEPLQGVIEDEEEGCGHELEVGSGLAGLADRGFARAQAVEGIGQPRPTGELKRLLPAAPFARGGECSGPGLDAGDLDAESPLGDVAGKGPRHEWVWV